MLNSIPIVNQHPPLDQDSRRDIMDATVKIVCASLGVTSQATEEQIVSFIEKVHGKVASLMTGTPASQPTVEAPKEPAVPIKKSITPDFLICLEDGKKFKSLKRHISTHYGLSPDEYRQRWGLPADYPMVAPNYAAKRSELAKASGLGKKVAA